MATLVVPPGTVFGRLTVTGEAPKRGGKRMMLCQCECGQQKAVELGALRSGNTKSCGCLRRGDVADPAQLNPGEIPLIGRNARRRVALVDEGDYELVSQYRWYAQDRVALGERPPLTYAKAMIIRGGRRTSIFMHSLVTGFARVDHQDGNGLNNQRSNLRDATHAQNMGNARKQLGRSSRFKGVYLAGGGRWQAYIGVNHRSRYLGRFVDEEAAARAYDAAALEAWGDFARLNFPRRG